MFTRISADNLRHQILLNGGGGVGGEGGGGHKTGMVQIVSKVYLRTKTCQ